MAETEARRVTGCEECGGVDNHPRAVHPLPMNDPRAEIREEVLDSLLKNGISGAMLRELQDPSAVIRHFDCCSAAGCPSGSCDEAVKKYDGKTGKTLIAAIYKDMGVNV